MVILHQGTLNTDAGPDFINARIRIGSLEWFGNIEIHIRSSDWQLHHHHHDEAYNNVILHVTWTDDEPVRRDNGSRLPTLVLKDRIPEKLILKYSSMVHNNEIIPCVSHLPSVTHLKKISMIDRAVVERLDSKISNLMSLIQRNKGDWQESAYQLFARNFGFKLNAEPFQRLAFAVPLKTLLWHRENLFQIEALLFGQAGLLEKEFADDYPNDLKKEYRFLGKKFSIDQSRLNGSEWKFLRIRPANFPTLRLAEFAALIYSCPVFFTSITEFTSVKEIYGIFENSKVSSYWTEHYLFDKKSDKKVKVSVGSDSINNIIINTVVPYLYFLGKERDQELYVDRALDFLEQINAEDNRITRMWRESGLEIGSAYDSQGAIELFNNYCMKKNCLDCEIGADILRAKEPEENKA